LTFSEKFLEEFFLLLGELVGHVYDVSDKQVARLAILLEHRHAFTLEPLH